MFSKFILFASLFSIISCGAGKNKTNVELVTAMMDQESIKYQDWDPSKKDNSAMRVPPENTVPRGFKPYKYKHEMFEAERKLKNPIANDMSPEVLSRGKNRYDIYCALCHGVTGKGDGQIAESMFRRPPSLVGSRVAGFKDGRVFHIITEGYGVMGSYSTQIKSKKDRWAIVNYLKSLQKTSAK